MKKIILSIAVLLLLFKVATIVLPPMVDRKLNGLIDEGPYKVSATAQRIYDDLPFVADLHCDALLWHRPMHKDLKRAHVDLPKMQQAKVDLQVFTVVSKSPKGLNFDNNDDDSDDVSALMIGQGRTPKAWFNLKYRVGVQSKDLHKLQKKRPEEFKIIKSKKDLQEVMKANADEFKLASGLFALEGAHPLKGEFENIEYVFNKGVRMIGLVHFFDNEVGGSAHGIEKGGLTDFGRQCIKEFERRNITIDLAHSSKQLIKEVTDMATRPVVASHTGVRGTCDRGRNLSDDQIRQIAKTGGLIGIGFFDETMCGSEVKLIADGIKYVRDLVGIEHVALGSDFDGSVEVPFNVTGLPIVVDELLKQGFTEPEIRRVMGENVRDLLLVNLPQ